MLLIKAACTFHRGYRKEMQEDNFLFDKQTLENRENGMLTCVFKNPQNVCFAVFDGLGGLPNGEKASKLAADTLKNIMERVCFFKEVDSSWIESTIFEIHQEIVTMERQQKHLSGTTMAILLIDNQRIYLGNVGDSRIYHFLDNKLTQLSEDHSDRNLLEELGIIDRNPSLMQYVGMLSEMGKVKPSIDSFENNKTGRYIVCTDGLTDMVCDDDIETICRDSKNAEECSEKLVQKALDNGGADNVTVIVCEFEEVSWFTRLTNFLK